MNINKIQKVVLSVSLSLLIIAVFLHNPLSGYVESNKYDIAYHPESHDPDCTPQFKAQIRSNFEKTRKEYNQFENDSKGFEKYVDRMVEIRCNKREAYKVKASVPFQELATKKPIIPWFGKLINLIQLIVVIGLISSIPWFLYKEK